MPRALFSNDLDLLKPQDTDNPRHDLNYWGTGTVRKKAGFRCPGRQAYSHSLSAGVVLYWKQLANTQAWALGEKDSKAFLEEAFFKS